MTRPAALVFVIVLALGLAGPAAAQPPPAEPFPSAVMALTGGDGVSRIVVLDPDGTLRVLTVRRASSVVRA